MLGKTAFAVLAVAGAVAVTACSTGSGEKGSGTEGSEARELQPFTLEQVKTEVSGDTLEVSQDEDIDPDLGITVEIRIPRLDMAELSGAGDLTARGIRGERFRAEVSGAGSVEADGRVRSVEVVVSPARCDRANDLLGQAEQPVASDLEQIRAVGPGAQDGLGNQQGEALLHAALKGERAADRGDLAIHSERQAALGLRLSCREPSGEPNRGVP